MDNHFCSYRDQKAERLVDILENFDRGTIVHWQFVHAGIEFVLFIEYRPHKPLSPIKQMRGMADEDRSIVDDPIPF